MRGVREQEDRLDRREVAVDDRHRRLVGHVDLRADALDEHVRPDIGAVVDQQADAPGCDDDVAGDAGVFDGPLEQGDALRDGQQRGLVGVVDDEHVHLVEEAGGTFDDVEVPEGDRVERARDNGDPVHRPSDYPADTRHFVVNPLPNRRWRVTPRRRSGLAEERPLALVEPPRQRGGRAPDARPARRRSRASPAPPTRASAMSSPSLATRSSRSDERPPDCLLPSTSPSRRSSRSMLRELEAVERGGHGIDALARERLLLGAGDEQAEPGHTAAADAAAQLVQLRDAEPVGVEDDHGRGVRHVDADLDDRRRDEHVDVAGGEGAHHLVLLVGRHPAVQHLDPRTASSGSARTCAATDSTLAIGPRRRPPPAPPPRRRPPRPCRVDRRADDEHLAALARSPRPRAPRCGAPSPGRSASGTTKLSIALAAGRQLARWSRRRGRRTPSSRRCAGSASPSAPARAAACRP